MLFEGFKSDEEDGNHHHYHNNHLNHGEVDNQKDKKSLDKITSIENNTRNEISKNSNAIDPHTIINNTISDFFDENHLFDLLNKQILFKNKKNKSKLNKIVNGECSNSASITSANQVNATSSTTTTTTTAAATANASNVGKESETNKSCSMSSTSSTSSSSTTSSNSKSALTGLDKKLLKKKIMSNIGKIKIEDYVSF